MGERTNDRLIKTYDESLVNAEEMKKHLDKPPNSASIHQSVLQPPDSSG